MLSRVGGSDVRVGFDGRFCIGCVAHGSECIGLVNRALAVSSKRLDDVGDFSRHGYTLRVDCRSCGRVAVLDPLRIVTLCQERGWSRQVGTVEARMRCSGCGSRQVRLGPGFR